MWASPARLLVLPCDDIRDPATGRTHTRLVDIHSEYYEVAREYMIRLEPSDLQNPEMLTRLAGLAHMAPEEFERAFAHAAGLSEREAQRAMRVAT